ncbi:venom allergen 5-like [Aphidius gifuensis]|uniref:venom allergen 5-like n=1 Tax=Aphidius gifuensis TaxID=684658 RepID=UPI001CDB6CC5|nr:venom allergen 5-like [Aphidius gifuensis]
MTGFFSLLVVAVSLIGFSSAQDWCNIESCNGKPQTMCLYPDPGAASACGEVESIELSEEEKQEIVQVHNDFRAKVASGQESRGDGGGQPAGDIPPLTWDDSIAEVAQRWASQCSFGHDQCRNTETEQAGQNVASKSASNGYISSMTDLVTMWYDEVDKFNPQGVYSYKFSMSTGHYSQLVWGTTTNIGCGVAKYFDGQWYNTYLVCNYSPPGNYEDAPVYNTSNE